MKIPSRLQHMRLRHAGKNVLQGWLIKTLLNGVIDEELELQEYCTIEKVTIIKFDIAIHQTEGTMGYVQTYTCRVLEVHIGLQMNTLEEFECIECVTIMKWGM